MAIFACWIVNNAGMRGGKALKADDLFKRSKIKRRQLEGEPKTQEEVQKMIDKTAWMQKQHGWTLFKDKYIPKDKK